MFRFYDAENILKKRVCHNAFILLDPSLVRPFSHNRFACEFLLTDMFNSSQMKIKCKCTLEFFTILKINKGIKNTTKLLFQ